MEALGYIVVGTFFLSLPSPHHSKCIQSLPDSDKMLDERPVIAIIGERLENDKILERYPEAEGKSYIAASYIKFMEMAGARVLPVSDTTNLTEIDEIFASTNGVLFPGGGANLLESGYERIAKRFFQLIQEGTERSDVYPMIAICLGMQQEAVLAAGENILSRTNSENIGLPMTFTAAVNYSRLFGNMPEDLKNTLSTTKAAFNNHHYGVLLKTFNSLERLNGFFNVLSTSRDRDGLEFVAAMEAKQYPIFGLQWHPEKNMFEWNPRLAICRSENAIKASQFITNRFVTIAKGNKHRLSSHMVRKLIYRYETLYTGDISSFEQIYVL